MARRAIACSQLRTQATKRRDEKLAQQDTRRWCADRCLATGYCDAVEDIYDMTTAQVKKFCENCAGEEECTLDYVWSA